MKNFKPQPWFLPQPVAIIGTYNADGTPNAMNAAWAGQWDSNQIMISLGSHATTDNLNTNPDFTLAFATVDTMTAADYVGIVSARKHPDKMAATGWTAVKAQTVNAPIFTDLPFTLECRMTRKYDESETGYFLIADIVNIVCDERYLDAQGLPDIEAMRLIAYEPVHHRYMALGQSVGQAFADGKKLK